MARGVDSGKMCENVDEGGEGMIAPSSPLLFSVYNITDIE